MVRLHEFVRDELVGRRLSGTRYYSLWSITQPFRLRRWVRGVDPASVVDSGKAEVAVYACTGFTLHGTLVAGESRTVRIARNGAPYATVDLQPNVGQQFSIPALVRPVCRLTFQSDGPFALQSLVFG